jgi:hypothetical protein
MSTQLRDLIANALYAVKAHTLPSVCERFGMEPGDGQEAFGSKTKYVMRRLEKLSDEKVYAIAREVVKTYPDDDLQAAIERLQENGRLVSDITRQHVAKALDGFSLGGSRDLMELLVRHFPDITKKPSYRAFEDSLHDDIYRHAVLNEDWDNNYILEQVGFLTCSQARMFAFLEDVLYPARRDEQDQEAIAAKLNPILRRDGVFLARSGQVSGYPTYKATDTAATGSQPADDLISKTLSSFDESGVHAAWQKALERRVSDPEGAITAAKSLLETVCKHIIEESGGTYGANDDLPKLNAIAAESLNLAPSQHSEPIFKAILGNSQAVISGLAAIRNKLGDSHGQGKRAVKPSARHAELAVNMAGTVALFLISTLNARKADKSGA